MACPKKKETLGHHCIDCKHATFEVIQIENPDLPNNIRNTFAKKRIGLSCKKTPRRVLEIALEKEHIKELTKGKTEEITEESVKMITAKEIREYLKEKSSELKLREIPFEV